MFLAPLSAVLVGATVARVAEQRPRLGFAGAVVLLGLMAGIDVTHPYGTPATRAAVELLEQRMQPGEPVYVSASANLPWAFYTTDWRRPDTSYLRAMARWAAPGGPAFHNAPSRGRGVAPNEGDSLVWSRGGRQELYGLAPGIQWREVTRMTSDSPDSGWAEVEARRIRAAGCGIGCFRSRRWASRE